MTNNIKVFENTEFGSIRTLELNDAPWFVGKDIALALGYVNTRKALQDNVDDEDKVVTKVTTSGGAQNTTIINESGLYALVFGSNLPKAKAFKRWVTSEVLPSIYHTGGYVANGREQEFINNTPALQSEIRSLHNAIAVLQMQVAPKKCDYAENTWKKRTSTPMAQKVADAYNKNIHDVYNMIYSCMKTNFGFDNVAAMIKYCDKYGLPMDGTVSAITAIADDPTYQMYFAKAVGILLKNAKATQVASELSAPQKKFTVNDDFDEIMISVAEKLGYDKPNKVVYEEVYNKITTKQGWRCLLTRYHCATKKHIIENERKYKVKFVDICNEILS